MGKVNLRELIALFGKGPFLKLGSATITMECYATIIMNFVS